MTGTRVREPPWSLQRPQHSGKHRGTNHESHSADTACACLGVKAAEEWRDGEPGIEFHLSVAGSSPAQTGWDGEVIAGRREGSEWPGEREEGLTRW